MVWPLRKHEAVVSAWLSLFFGGWWLFNSVIVLQFGFINFVLNGQSSLSTMILNYRIQSNKHHQWYCIAKLDCLVIYFPKMCSVRAPQPTGPFVDRQGRWPRPPPAMGQIRPETGRLARRSCILVNSTTLLRCHWNPVSWFTSNRSAAFSLRLLKHDTIYSITSQTQLNIFLHVILYLIVGLSSFNTFSLRLVLFRIKIGFADVFPACFVQIKIAVRFWREIQSTGSVAYGMGMGNRIRNCVPGFIFVGTNRLPSYWSLSKDSDWNIYW